MDYWPDKRPDEVLDYQIDWSARLGTDTISIVEWDVPDGLILVRTSKSNTFSTLWLSEGESGLRYSIRCLITTVGGRILEETVGLVVR